MFFIFHEDCCPNYLVLEQVFDLGSIILMLTNLHFQFEYLTELELFGGSFYRDKISALLERRGRGLTRLHLISVASVDYRFEMGVL